ncbi:hypothetical protein M3Y97_00265100 [Aphelenchoides bicaudatus]|nr:hypothetical protein M3Y97_00265100 [Aphelenchoides bicaudatus]
MSLKEDPHFEQVHNELQGIDKLLFYSVFIRLPTGANEHQAPKKPADALDRVDALTRIECVTRKSSELEDRLKELQDNTEQFSDMIADYLDDLEEAQKSLRTLKNIVQPDSSKSETEASWLTTYKNILSLKINKEHIQLDELTETETKTKEEMLERLKALDKLIKTAGMLQDTARYLQWFTNRVTEENDSKPEHQKDFTIGLVISWVNSEITKAKEHEQNCFNVKSELESKAFE